MNSQQTEIVLATINARYYHTSFGLRCLMANMDELKARTSILEFEGTSDLEHICSQIAALEPKIIGLGVYIWNATAMQTLIPRLREDLPETIIVVGGPEVSYTPATHPVAKLSDYTVCGEAELSFARLCRNILRETPPENRIIAARPPLLNKMESPYRFYSDQDLEYRNIYVESTRGCPFQCDYCVSGREEGIREFDLQAWFRGMEYLLERGARKFIFVDRTFNAKPKIYLPVLEFFRERYAPGLKLYLEIMPTLFPTRLKNMLQGFPPASLRLEVGVQSLNEEVNRRIGRPQQRETTLNSLRFITEETGCHLHADLIAGLPGETLDSIADSFNQLLAIRPDELQFGILKRLPGTNIGRHDREWEMIYSEEPPYSIIRNRNLNRETMDKLKRFGRYWRIVVTRGRFPNFAQEYILSAKKPFERFWDLSDYLFIHFQRTNRIDLLDLAIALDRFLVLKGYPQARSKSLIRKDYSAGGKRRLPRALRSYTPTS